MNTARDLLLVFAILQLMMISTLLLHAFMRIHTMQARIIDVLEDIRDAVESMTDDETETDIWTK